MNVLIVGTVMKDVYLNLDSRKESFETDKHNTKWLNLSFDASEHYFFHRKSCLGGAAVTLEVLSKMGLDAKIMGSDLHFAEDGLSSSSTDVYRYILISDQTVSYFTPSTRIANSFIPPTGTFDYVFIDRSANLDDAAASRIVSYLESHPQTMLALYLPNNHDPRLESLAKIANIIFIETASSETPVPNLNNHHQKQSKPSPHQQAKASDASRLLIYLNEHSIVVNSLTESLNPKRVDVSTHLSIYSTASATILGGIILGFSLESCLKMARVNVENSKLDASLSLSKMQDTLTTKTPKNNLELIAANLLTKKKGILAADESGGSIQKKFAQLDIPDTYENRRSYRDILLTAPNLEKYVNGVILFDETTHQNTKSGENFVKYLINHRIIPGIKVDQGLVKFAESTPDFCNITRLINPEETWTKGLADLDQRLKEYYQMGLRFAKWRSAFEIRVNDNSQLLTPTDEAIGVNCEILAQYAKKCQLANIVPIVEPEVVYNGNYSIEQSFTVTTKILDRLFTILLAHDVNLSACILKTNMVIAGKQSSTPSTSEEVGQATARALKNYVPPELAGIVFLSGGQTVEQATNNLAAVIKNGPFPWPVTFSFARALQDPALYAWNGNDSNTESAKSALIERLIANTSVLN
ncbi:fructose-bisphosphate aldolase class I [Candidatus Saccharibacteria bacterium]|nr:fructose-bisphosphate aldolase class I [Candidatus Saccharibacteria bacterium]